VLSSYAIKFNSQLFGRFSPLFNPARAAAEVAEPEQEKHAHPIVMLGFHRGGQALVDQLAVSRPDILRQIMVVDFTLEVLQRLKAMNIACVFGDITSVDTLEHAHIDDAKVILSTIPDLLLKGTTNSHLVRTCRALAPHATIVATADTNAQIAELKRAGANEVILPYSLAGEYLAKYLTTLHLDLAPTP
jgi:Trk K+ transport system NAD-binding subunit